MPGTVERVETNVDSNAPYEAHIVKSDGTEEELYSDDSELTNKDSNLIAYKNPLLLALFVSDPGTYKIKLSRDTTVLAEGTFTYR